MYQDRYRWNLLLLTVYFNPWRFSEEIKINFGPVSLGSHPMGWSPRKIWLRPLSLDLLYMCDRKERYFVYNFIYTRFEYLIKHVWVKCIWKFVRKVQLNNLKFRVLIWRQRSVYSGGRNKIHGWFEFFSIYSCCFKGAMLKDAR